MPHLKIVGGQLHAPAKIY